MLGTAIINLVDNALKYSDRPIEIDAHDDGGGLVIRVRDRGIGIPAEELSRIGRRFFRASNAATRAGTGLGLYSSRKLLAYHDGILRLRSEEHTSELQSLMRISYAVFCFKKKKKNTTSVNITQ